MALDLVDYEKKTQKAVKSFWKTRNTTKKKQLASGKPDQGERGSVTSGKNMNGFINMLLAVIHANGLKKADIHIKKSLLHLPGFYRATKQWIF